MCKSGQQWANRGIMTGLTGGAESRRGRPAETCEGGADRQFNYPIVRRANNVGSERCPYHNSASELIDLFVGCLAGTKKKDSVGAAAMNSFETTATVEAEGQVHLVGVPFAPGTEVEVTIKAVANGGDTAAAPASERAGRLFTALDRARNTEPVGPLRREELDDRKVLR